MHNTVLHIFRRDLRLADNTALKMAIEHSDKVICVFIFDPLQIGQNVETKSDNAVQFMVESLQELPVQCFHGEVVHVLRDLIDKTKCSAVYFNRDYTPYSKERDSKITELCRKMNVECYCPEDRLLLPIESVRSKADRPYLIFTHYRNEHVKHKVPMPSKYSVSSNISSTPIKSKYAVKDPSGFYDKNPDIAFHGGRSNGMKILANLKIHKKYEVVRDDLSGHTTNLSAHLKFGTVSLREAYHAVRKILGPQSKLLDQLIWTDFFCSLMHYFPASLKKGLKPEYENMKWNDDPKVFKAWAEGNTGFPCVDACQRQLLRTGYMSNRGRLIVANFLCKDLYVSWHKGRKHFDKYLIDDDCANNSFNWMFSASVGSDPEKYGKIRMFNPWLQSKKHDPQAAFIKKWVPELNNVPANHIHSWDVRHQDHPRIKYLKPMVDHAKAAARTVNKFHTAKAAHKQKNYI